MALAALGFGPAGRMCKLWVTAPLGSAQSSPRGQACTWPDRLSVSPTPGPSECGCHMSRELPRGHKVQHGCEGSWLLWVQLWGKECLGVHLPLPALAHLPRKPGFEGYLAGGAQLAKYGVINI